jgi:hypothetical protein
MNMNVDTLEQAVVPVLDAYQKIVFDVIPHSATAMTVAPLITRGSSAVKPYFKWRTKRSPVVKNDILFGGKCVKYTDTKIVMQLNVDVPDRPATIRLSEREWQMKRLCLFQTMCHETVHAHQFAHLTSAFDPRVFGTQRYRECRSSKKSEHDDMVYLSASHEIEAYASCIALEWVCRYPTLNWRSFCSFWRTNYQQFASPQVVGGTPSSSEYRTYDWYAYYFADAWSTHAVMRRLRPKTRQFAELYRESSAVQAFVM